MTTLLESLLLSEFKFGFELEAYVDENVFRNSIGELNDDYDDYDYSNNESHWDDDQIDYEEDDLEANYSVESYPDFFELVADYFSQWFGDDLTIEDDGSLGFCGFEFPTPPMNLTPANVKKCIDFLLSIQKSEFKIHTDETCGFHLHLSYPNMTHQDMAWILCNIACNEEYINTITTFTKEDGVTIPFFSKKWSSKDFLNTLSVSIKKEDWSEVSKLLTNEKYRIIRLHPQGTIEWRGPRNFISKDGIKDITSFFYKVLQFAKIISTIMDKKDINGMSKENFFKMVDISSINSNPKYFNENKIEPLAKAIIKNPLILTKLGPSNIDQAIVRKIYNILGKIGFHKFLTNLRYKDFKGTDKQFEILMLEPSFIKYLNNPEKVLRNFGASLSPIKIFANVKGLPVSLIKLIINQDKRWLIGHYSNALSLIRPENEKSSWLLKPFTITFIKANTNIETLESNLRRWNVPEHIISLFK